MLQMRMILNRGSGTYTHPPARSATPLYRARLSISKHTPSILNMGTNFKMGPII